MAKPPIIYDLVLILSTTTEEEERAKIVADVEAAISAGGGTLERSQIWGVRPMTFEINHQGEGYYHLLQFAGPPSLLESLSHSLRIADNVLRFRIIKVLAGTPPAPDTPPPVLATAAAGASSPGERDRGERERERDGEAG
ncbi:MAG: 30S ribosomal protein S6 [Actinomycetota bacterium]|nr:30S ribosomal protein S6 [Actinomycetota bacterium]